MGDAAAEMTRRVERAERSERGPVRRRLVSTAVVVAVLAGTLGAGEAGFRAIPAQIAQAIRGRTAWVVGNHADEIRNWDQRSRVIFQARATDPSGNGEVWQQRREYDWNGAHVLLTALDLARRLYLIKPPTRKG
ncbi:hypothetical protein [Streptomyces sp. NPDC093589]|uniref:hypothetical protein n=1 Tax=Streptomyces sp. NPDC093589 TaxID=3366043 RepID=UPI00380D52B1